MEKIVLILVLVEDGLRATNANFTRSHKQVLILVLVEDGLRENASIVLDKSGNVS